MQVSKEFGNLIGAIFKHAGFIKYILIEGETEWVFTKLAAFCVQLVQQEEHCNFFSSMSVFLYT